LLSSSVSLSLSSCSKMAEARISENEFMCTVCLDLLKEPVAIHCGHSYCKSCITDYWDQEDDKNLRCPQCRHTFSPRPALDKNIMLAEVVEKLRKAKISADCYAGAGDVQCDACTGRKYKAVKSCLVCQESYCQTHFDRHEEFHSSKPHRVIDATGRLQDMICHKHDKQLEMYCITDQQCICVLCKEYEHKNHKIVSSAAQWTEDQKQLKETEMKFQHRIQQRQKDLQQLREAVESHKRSAQTAVEDTERIFTEFIRFIERSRFKSFQSLSAAPGSSDIPIVPFSSLPSFDAVRESVHQLRDKLKDFCKEEIKKICDIVTCPNIVPKTRNDLLQYSHQFTLDANTVNKCLQLSKRNRVIKYTDKIQSYPDHPDRFDYWYQVLCTQSVCGRSYWEIEWSGQYVCISVSYKSISRKGNGYECLFGHNDQSWSLFCFPSSYSLWHNNKQTDLPAVSIGSRIGVYVDHSAGTLSFYSISDMMNLIHTVQTTFTQPLYPGFYVWSGSSVKLC
ncbi:hypothetical protein cypCar_00029541, partial [Cyprinus carpio]